MSAVPSTRQVGLRSGRLLLVLIAVSFALMPVYAAFLGALTPLESLGTRQLVPEFWHWANFAEVWQRIPLGRYLLTTTIYAVSAGALGTVLAAHAGYALSRLRFTGKKFFLYFLLISQVVPLVVVAIPLFALVTRLGLFDTYVAVILTITAITLPFPTFLLRAYFDRVPTEIEEAALVDGCSRFIAFWRVVLPISTPGLFTSFALVFFTAWQQFLIPLVLTESRGKVPVTVGLFRLIESYVVPWNLVMAGALIASIPPVVVFLLAQRFLVQGMSAGAVK